MIVSGQSALAEEIPHFGCFQQASKRYGIDVYLLLAIAAVESNFDMSAKNDNNNGSFDHGVMQINTRWQPALEELDIDWAEVLKSPCVNIHVGAWVLATNFATSGVNWQAVGAYNAGYQSTERARKNRLRYATKVSSEMNEIRAQHPKL